MYAHCIFCKSALGANQSIETFPVGRRLAFDAARGRLWVVCQHCTRWNLSPLDERWEAIEECERQYRDTRTRFATANIGLARLRDGLDLVRVGEPQRPEFAAWRYSQEFRRRHRRTIIAGGTIVAAAAGIVVSGPTLGILSGAGAQLLFNVSSLYNVYRTNVRTVLRLPTQSGGQVRLKAKHLDSTALIPSQRGWTLDVEHTDGRLSLSGADALRTAAIILANLNSWGAPTKTIQQAVREIERAQDAETYFSWVALRLSELRRKANRSNSGNWFTPRPRPEVDRPYLGLAPADVLLALEMMAHEDNERRALEGELKELEAMWREADAIASISDNLLIPAAITDFIMQRKNA